MFKIKIFVSEKYSLKF